MSILDIALAHYKATTGTIVEIPEWTPAGEPTLRALVRPLTIAEKRTVMKLHEGDKTGVDATIKCIIRATTNADTGAALFKESDLPAIRNGVHPAIVNRLGKALDDLDTDGAKSLADAVDAAEGN
ncbi:hypothetical protein [Acuticoccus mangrovi]|uniref:Phage tail protein n=1 Tax=Acuticoccus mangrovi TaxID=2796142 RepID=A0A934MLI5_9HYPH|nr:hypothetical protein [Acuticoccus mangrovi]MBJ3776399.1 hypothetical protein [Acuticoccus mangrovi]